MNEWMPPISRRTQTAWARELLVEAIDNFLEEPPEDWDADDRAALKKERDRVAKFLAPPPPVEPRR